MRMPYPLRYGLQNVTHHRHDWDHLVALVLRTLGRYRQVATFEIDLVPSQFGNLGTATSGQNQKPRDAAHIVITVTCVPNLDQLVIGQNAIARRVLLRHASANHRVGLSYAGLHGPGEKPA